MRIYPTPHEIETAFSQIAAGYPSNADMINAEIEQNVRETELLMDYLDKPLPDIIE